MQVLVRRTALRVTVLTALLLVLAGPAAPAVPAAPAAAPGAHRQGSIPTRIDRFLTTQLEESAIPGAAVAVTRGDRVLMVRGYGHDSTGAAVTGDTLFRTASLSKSFTALAVMQLVDAGLVGLDDPVRHHLPEFEMADPRAGRVTVRELLDHSSGITDAVVPDLSRRQPTSPRDATTSLRSAHLATAPGASYSYANPNYRVAARLVEVVSGEPFDRYLRHHVLGPAGMTSTTSTVTDERPVPGLADGHLIAYGHAFTAPAYGTYTIGDGGVVSSATDMARWLVVHANGGRTADGTRLVSGPGLRLLHTPSAPGGGYALGWATHGPPRAPTRLEHSGSLFTFTSQEALWPASGYGVVLLFNSGSPMMLDQTAIVHGVFDIVEGTAPPASGPHLARRIDTALAALTLAALALGASGVVRAGRWTGRHRHAPLRAGFGLLAPVLVLLAGAAFPTIAQAWVGRDVTWRAAAYQWPAVVVLLCAALVAATATLLARSRHWRRALPARTRPHRSRAGDPTDPHRPNPPIRSRPSDPDLLTPTTSTRRPR